MSTNDLESAIIDIEKLYLSMKERSLSSTACNEMFYEYLQRFNGKKANGKWIHTRTLHQQVSAVIRTYQRIISKEVEFCYLIDGQWYSVEKKSNKPTTDELYKHGISLREAKGNLVWKHSDSVYF